jgi:hypothetical protein
MEAGGLHWQRASAPNGGVCTAWIAPVEAFFHASTRVSLHPADCRWSGRTGQVGTGLGWDESFPDGMGLEPAQSAWDLKRVGWKTVGTGLKALDAGRDGTDSRGRDNLYEHGSSRP